MRCCTDEATGRAGCEVWALRHLAALQAYDERRHLTWLAGQTWRGRDAELARERLLVLDRKAQQPLHPGRGPHGRIAGPRGNVDGHGSRGRSESVGRAPRVAGESIVTQASAACSQAA